MKVSQTPASVSIPSVWLRDSVPVTNFKCCHAQGKLAEVCVVTDGCGSGLGVQLASARHLARGIPKQGNLRSLR